jgi:hypothetical protein
VKTNAKLESIFIWEDGWMDGQANGRMDERVERVELKQSLIFYLYLYRYNT